MNLSTSRKLFITLGLILSLPATAVAKDFLTITPVSSGKPLVHTVGFSETEPSGFSFENVVTVEQFPGQLVSTGFAETDPANNIMREDWIARHTGTDQVPQVHVGFEESDPSINSEPLFCLEANIEEKTVQISQVFSSIGILGQ